MGGGMKREYYIAARGNLKLQDPGRLRDAVEEIRKRMSSRSRPP